MLHIVGPGCSSLAYGFAEEFGPYRILPDASGVYLHEYGWNRGLIMLPLFSFFPSVILCVPDCRMKLKCGPLS